MREEATGGGVEQSSTAEVDALWLAALEQLCRRAAHELKGALNGVAVNIEVLRSRTRGSDPAMARLAPHAGAAAEQLDAVIDLASAILVLARPVRQPTQLGPLVRSVHSVLAPAGRVENRKIALDASVEDERVTSAPGHAALLAVSACLMAAADSSADVYCGLRAPSDADAGEKGPRSERAVQVYVECRDGGIPAVDQTAVDAALRAGIAVEQQGCALSITFPG